VEKPPKTTDSNELIESAFGQQMIDQLEDIIGEYKYVTTGSKQAMREMTRVWERNYFESDLDAFETFIQDRLTELDRRLAGDERFLWRASLASRTTGTSTTATCCWRVSDERLRSQ